MMQCFLGNPNQCLCFIINRETRKQIAKTVVGQPFLLVFQTKFNYGKTSQIHPKSSVLCKTKDSN